jgi:tRNA A-37 threonylcarbamoyl transferase component Bud32
VILAPGARVGPYVIVSAIGRGGVGEVYLADDPRLRRRVALKILNAKFAEDESARGRFLREAQMAASLDHPNICALHEIGTDGGSDYLVMPFLRGETLAQRLERGRLPAKDALDISVQLADALAYAHASGVIHRDIKPQNVMLTPEGRVKLMDFGLAKAPGRLDDQQETHAALTEAGVFLGTIAYMSPEQLAGHPADERSDIFSLGMTLYEIFAGRHPFVGPTHAATISAIASRPAPPLSEAAPDAPPALTPILVKALALDPRERYQSTRDLLADLEAVRRGEPIVAGGPAVRRAHTRPAVVIALIAAAMALSAAAWLYPWSRPASPSSAAGPASLPGAPVPAVSTWLEIQPVTAGVGQSTHKSSGAEVLKNGWKFWVHVVANTPGSLYIVGDEHTLTTARQELTLLYPLLGEAGQIQDTVTTGSYVVSGPPADTSLWVVWSRTPIAELDDLKPLANPEVKGIVGNRAKADAVRRLLSAGETSSGANLVVRRLTFQQR